MRGKEKLTIAKIVHPRQLSAAEILVVEPFKLEEENISKFQILLLPMQSQHKLDQDGRKALSASTKHLAA